MAIKLPRRRKACRSHRHHRLQQFAYQTRSTPAGRARITPTRLQRATAVLQLPQPQQQQILLLNQQSAQRERLNQRLTQQIQQFHQQHQQQYNAAIQGAPLVLPFDHVFRNPATAIERDITYSANDIQKISCANEGHGLYLMSLMVLGFFFFYQNGR